MFKGRKKELELLEDLYDSKQFEFFVLYGRRRVGKTELLKEFTKNKKPLFFSAQEKNDSLNLLDFSKTVQTYFDNDFFCEFSDWETALKYVTSKATEDRLVIVIDEFPYIASENKSINKEHFSAHNRSSVERKKYIPCSLWFLCKFYGR